MHKAKTPAALTASWVSILERYSDNMKCPSADSKIPRQNTSSDCCPQRITGFAADHRKKPAFGDMIAATRTTVAKNGTSRMGDKLFLLTGHNSFRRKPGNASQMP